MSHKSNSSTKGMIKCSVQYCTQIIANNGWRGNRCLHCAGNNFPEKCSDCGNSYRCNDLTDGICNECTNILVVCDRCSITHNKYEQHDCADDTVVTFKMLLQIIAVQNEEIKELRDMIEG